MLIENLENSSSNQQSAIHHSVGGREAPVGTTGVRDAKNRKEIRCRQAAGPRSTALDRRCRSSHAEGEVREVRRDRRDRDAPWRRSEARRSDGARNRRPATRTRQDEARAGDPGRGYTQGTEGG